MEQRYEEEKQKLLKTLGAIGGKPSKKDTVVNTVFVVLVIFFFILSFITEGKLHQGALEIGLLLLSFKLAFFLHNEAKINHFQFWTLITIDQKLNTISQLVRKNKKEINGLDKQFEDIQKQLEALKNDT